MLSMTINLNNLNKKSRPGPLEDIIFTAAADYWWLNQYICVKAFNPCCHTCSLSPQAPIALLEAIPLV